MADILVEGSAQDNITVTQGSWGPYYISPTVGALVAMDSSDDVNVYRTDDGGATWNLIEVTSFTTEKLAVYFDQQNPGDAGTLLHIWWEEALNGVLRYNTLDISDGSLGTQRTIATLEPGDATSTGVAMAGCKTRSGNLLCTGRSHDGTAGVTFAYRSVDGGENWTSRTTGWEDGAGDSGKLYAANTGDGADAALIYYDDSAAELSVKMYDDSADTWTETGILTSVDLGSVTNSVTHYMFDASILHSDGRIFGASFSNPNVAGNDLRTFVITPDSIASPTIDTTTANILTDVTEAGYCAVAIDQTTDTVYVAYGNGSALSATIGVDYVVSDDLMESWGSPVTYAEGTDDDFRAITGPSSAGAGGGLIQWAFFNDDLNDIYVNLVNDEDVTSTSTSSTSSSTSTSSTSTSASSTSSSISTSSTSQSTSTSLSTSTSSTSSSTSTSISTSSTSTSISTSTTTSQSTSSTSSSTSTSISTSSTSLSTSTTTSQSTSSTSSSTSTTVSTSTSTSSTSTSSTSTSTSTTTVLTDHRTKPRANITDTPRRPGAANPPVRGGARPDETRGGAHRDLRIAR